MVVFTNLTIALYRAPDRIVIAYVGFWIQQKSKKLKNERGINDLHDEMEKDPNATSKLTVSNAVKW